MTKIKYSVNKELAGLWEMRDNARNDKSRSKAQDAIDEYFLGSPAKGSKRKKKDKKKKWQEEDWEYFEE